MTGVDAIAVLLIAAAIVAGYGLVRAVWWLWRADR